MSDTTGYIRNCYIWAREGDTLVTVTPDNHLVPSIDGYAIIPREEYEKLKTQLAEVKQAFLDYARLAAHDQESDTCDCSEHRS